MNGKIAEKILKILLDNIEEGIHFIDKKGRSEIYNGSMEKIEGLAAEEVIGKHLLEVFPDWNENNSTLLTAINRKRPQYNEQQNYINYKGDKISSVNTTFPVEIDGEMVGALEISKNYTEVSKLSSQITKLQDRLSKGRVPLEDRGHYTFESLIGRDSKYLEAMRIARLASRSDSTVLITGETGTGKELFSQSIHYESARKSKPFVAVNCASLPESLLESLLFGTLRGSFTGSMDKPGLFEQANGGTLFLDEVNSMSLLLQSKLLRVLQDSYVRRIGAVKDVRVDVRVIAATNEDPMKMVSEGLMRKDLYYRLNVIGIHIPPLRDRRGDIRELLDYFINFYSDKLDRDITGATDDVYESMQKHDFKGNVRELQNLVESAISLKDEDGAITLADLPHTFFSRMDDSYVKGYATSVPLSDYLEDIEKNIIQTTYLRERGNVSRTAQALSLSRQALQYKLKKYGIS